MRRQPIKIAAVPAIQPIDRVALASQIEAARDAATRCLQAVVATGVFRDAGLSVSAKLAERAEVLTSLLEAGAPDVDLHSWLDGFAALIADANVIAADPAALQAAHDLLAVGPRVIASEPVALQ